ncbi:MAG: glutamate synthase-related protein [Deltaproteobacteria bacterium]|jgi:glutamate synthase domain-containing protein 3
METIDLSTMSIRKANEIIRGFGSTKLDVEIVNPDAKHYIAVGLISPIRVRIRGSAGYFCGGLTDGPHIEVEKNVSWGVGDNMFLGSVVVNGNAGAIAGEGMRGGEIVVKGNIGSRAGQVMKKGTICCAGRANFMAGYLMYGGRLIILGDSGPRVGEDMAGGVIFVGGKVESLGNFAEVVEPTALEIDNIMEFLDRYDLRFKGTFKKIVTTGKQLKYGIPEPRIRNMPFYSFSGKTVDYWNKRIQQDIQVKSVIGRYRIRGFGASRHLPHFPDLAFKSDLSKVGTDPDVVSKVNLRTFFGDRHGGRNVELSMPVMIAPMSLGALSPQIKVALAIASRLSNIAHYSGEGGMYSPERAEARVLIMQCLAGRFGFNMHDLHRADGIEIYVSQGAKPGLGGQLMAEKLTPEIAKIRGIPSGMDLMSPSRHPDILGGDDFRMKVDELREAVGGRIPVSVKLGGGRTREDVKMAFKDRIDYVSLDGSQGGTGASNNEVLEYMGIPSLAALQEAMDGMEEIEAAGQMPIILMGGIRDGVDAVKAIALGATAVSLGTSMLMAAGCIGCMQCSVGSCTMGAQTQVRELTDRFDVETKARRIHRYLETFRWQMAAVVNGLGYNDIRQLSRDDLVALTPEAAAYTRLPYEPDQRDRLRQQIEQAKGGLRS